jgi:hypothetical protein
MERTNRSLNTLSNGKVILLLTTHGNRASAPPGTQITRGAQPPSAAGGSIGGESVLAVSAPLVINVQTSREAIRAVGARVAALSAERAASAARVTPVTPEVDMLDGGAEVPRPSFNRQWLNVVIAYAKDRK